MSADCGGCGSMGSEARRRLNRRMPKDHSNRNATFNHFLTFQRNAGDSHRPTSEAHMRNDWTLTPSEMALFIAAVTCLAGGFVMAAG